MEFTTFIFGNGLGRSISPYFELQNGINSVWDEELSLDIKSSIVSCLPEVAGVQPDKPTSEEQLLLLHEVTNACRKLRKLEPLDPEWLTENFREFPEAIDEFVARVSFHFHRFPTEDFTAEYIGFITGLVKYLKKFSSHLATLNYDNLLYQPLVENKVLDGFNGHLIDGFTTGTGFKAKNLVRLYGKKQRLGWYLHLHGSPLFYNDGNGEIKKYSQKYLDTSFEASKSEKRHVVLCHTKDKPNVIAESKILKVYWRYLTKALNQSDTLYIFGYGGADSHLNKEISAWIEMKKDHGEDFVLKIIEWKNPREDLNDRKSFWSSILSTEEFKVTKDDIKMRRLGNILNFDWETELA